MRRFQFSPSLEFLESRLPLDGSDDGYDPGLNDGSPDAEVGSMPVVQPPDHVLYPQTDPTGATDASVRPDYAVDPYA